MNLLGFVCSNYSLVVVRIVVMVWYEKESWLIKWYSFTLNKSNFWNKNPNNRVYNIERFPMTWLKKHFWSGFIFLYYSYLCVVLFYIKVWLHTICTYFRKNCFQNCTTTFLAKYMNSNYKCWNQVSSSVFSGSK